MLYRVSNDDQSEYVEINLYNDDSPKSVSVSTDGGEEQTVSLELLFSTLKSAGFKVSKI
jgi:hypothetical protein